MPTLTPCSRKPAAEAEAEIGWLAGWTAGWSGKRLGHVLGNLPRTSPRAGLGRAGGGGGKREPRCSKVLLFALLAHFSHFGPQNAKIMKLSSKTHSLHFWLPKVARNRYEYKPFCTLAKKYHFLVIFRFLIKFRTFWSQDAKK